MCWKASCLHAFDGKTPSARDHSKRIRELKKFYELDLDSSASHRTEGDQGEDPHVKGNNMTVLTRKCRTHTAFAVGTGHSDPDRGGAVCECRSAAHEFSRARMPDLSSGWCWGYGEIFGCVLLLIPHTTVRGAWLLLGIFTMAIMIHLLHGMYGVGDLVIFAGGSIRDRDGRGELEEAQSEELRRGSGNTMFENGSSND